MLTLKLASHPLKWPPPSPPGHQPGVFPNFIFIISRQKGGYRECRCLRSVSVADKLGEIAEQVRKAADEGDFAAYIQAQGGPCTPSNQQTLRVAYQINDQLNAYDEEVQKVVGIYAQLKNPVNNCRKSHLATLSNVRYFEPDSISRLTNHLHEYGFAFTKTDAESAGEDPLIDMFIKGMSLSDKGHLFTFDGDQIRFSESDALKNKRKQVVEAKKAAQRQQYQQRCTEIVTNIMKK